MTNDQHTSNDAEAGLNYWLSLDQYEGNIEFAKRAENEFLSSPLKSEDGKGGFARREFLKLMGASIAMATTACVRRPVQKIIPYAQAPKGYTPGIPNFYASTWFDGLEGAGLLVKTIDGRPIKLEGNPHHPLNTGRLPARAHAEVLALYDPDRLKGPIRNLPNKNRTNHETISSKWEEADTAVVEALGKGGVALLTGTLPSPSSRALVNDFQKAYGARWVQYDAVPVDAIVEAQRRSYGHALLPTYRFDQAKMVVAIDADFLGTHISPTQFMRQWAPHRKPGADMLRMVAFESSMTLTGMNSDDRYRIRPSQQIDVVFALLNAVVKASHGAVSVPGSAAGYLKEYDNAAAGLGLKPEELAKLGEELWANRGKSLVLAGGLATADAVDLQVAVNLLNSVLGNDGKTIDHESLTLTRQGSTTDLAKLIADMNSGAVKTLVIHNLNPAYVLSADAGFVEAAAKVPFIVYTGNYNDETGGLANFVLPAGSTLEAWGDYELATGVYSIQQPTIQPIFGSRSFEESLLAWTQKASGAPARAKAAKDWFEYVHALWKAEVYPKAGKGQSFDDFWQTVLQNGVVDVAHKGAGASRAFTGTVTQPKNTGTVAKPKGAGQGLELVLYPSVQLADGRYANVPWLQELPDPVTKVVWDNYVMVSPAFAREQNLRQGDVIELTVNKKSVKVPAFIQPGLHDAVLALALGYGRKGAGKVAKDIGLNAYALTGFTGSAPTVFAGLAVTFKKTGERYKLVSTGDHHSMEGRQIVAETTNAAYQKNPESGIHRHKVFSIWPEHQYTKHRWAMSIDLNQCTGCSACVIACQSENNVPVVGKTYVGEGREMHWIRIDRYFKGTPENPESVFMPLTCQQCETAPCETVCPVLATVHNDEGLNDMVYNRCVGTRYCSNNCPYKVRRFNWFNYDKKREAPLEMALNPDVTVRTRGVMEKCTFCVQRIRAVTTGVGKLGKPEKIKDGEIQTACQETCPTDAIIFGDLGDPESRVAKLFAEKRTYALLEDLNTVPRVRYMSRVRNAERVVAEASEHGHEEAPKEGSPAREGAPEKGHGHGSIQQEMKMNKQQDEAKA